MANDKRDGDRFDSLEDLLKHLRGRGWVGADHVGGGYRLGFEIGGHDHTEPVEHYHRVGSWTTGAGRGYTIYRTDVEGETVDVAITAKWPEATRSAYVAVHDDDGRGARVGAFSDGYPRLSRVPEAETE